MMPVVVGMDDPLSAKSPALLASETIGPLFISFMICAACVHNFLPLSFGL